MFVYLKSSKKKFELSSTAISSYRDIRMHAGAKETTGCTIVISPTEKLGTIKFVGSCNQWYDNYLF